MKILAIRGSNLASLAGELEIDRTKSPLAVIGALTVANTALRCEVAS